MIELEKAEGLEERWGRAQAAVMVFGDDPTRINATARTLRKAMLQAGLSIVSESINLPEAYRAFLPAGGEFSVRNMEMNATQFGAASLIYRSSSGQVTVDDLSGEEAQYVFICPDGTLYHFSPFVGGKGVVIGIGPIRSGKTFTIANVIEPPGGDLLAALAGPEVVGWATRVRVPAVISSERDTRGVTLIGIEPERERDISFVADDVVEGRFLESRDDRGLVVGRRLLERLATDVGKRVVIMSQDRDNEVADRGFRIVGVSRQFSNAAESVDTDFHLTFIHLFCLA